MVPCAGPVFEELHVFLCVCVCFFRDKAALKLLEVVIHNGEIKPLGGWQAVAFATRTLGILDHSTLTHSVNLFRQGQLKERTQVLIRKVFVSFAGRSSGVKGL